MKQRDKMRELYNRYGDNPDLLIHMYAEAERNGEVTRQNNTYHMTAEEYATRLLADARKKGWIPSLR